MTEQLTVNGKELDTIPNQITRKIRVAKLGKINDRLSSISQQFKLPRNTKNTTVFEQLGVIGNSSRIPYSELRTNYTIDTISLVNNGYMTVESTDEDYFNVRIQDGIIDLASKLKGLKLSDLPLADLNHFLNAQNYESSFTNTEGYIYAYGDFGYGTTKVEHQAPSIFAHTIWSKIFQNIGVEFEGDFFTTNSDYLNEVITSSVGYVPVNSNTSTTNRGGADSDTITVDETSTNYLTRTDNHTFTNVNLSGFSIVGGNIRSNITGRLDLTVSSQWTNTNSLVSVNVRKNGRNTAIFSLAEGPNQNKTTRISINVVPNDVISVSIGSSSKTPNDNGGSTTSFSIDYSASNDITVQSITGGLFMDVSQVIGNMNQVDFVKDVMNRYGLFMTPVKDNLNVYRFQQIDEVLTDTSNALDWTSKLVTYGKETYDSGLAKENYMEFKYTQDVQDFTQDGTLTVDDFNAKSENTLYSSPFEIPVTTSTFQSEPLYSIPLFEDKDGELQPKETPNKLMSIKRKTATVSIRFFNDASVSYTGSIPILSLDDIDMQDFLDTYYAQYKNLMNDYVARDCTVDLSAIDIANLRFDRLYYFGQLSRYCFFNEVQYKAGTNAKVSLVQISKFA